jgi:hypothetical protein
MVNGARAVSTSGAASVPVPAPAFALLRKNGKFWDRFGRGKKENQQQRRPSTINYEIQWSKKKTGCNVKMKFIKNI